MIALIKRNLKLYFRDRAAVFFSLLSIFITIGLYVLFLSDLMMEGALETLDDGELILHLWLLGGLLSISSVTTPMAALESMVKDKDTGKQKDFFVSRMPRYQLALSYILSAILIGMVMVTCTLCFGFLLILIQDGEMLAWEMVLKAMIVSCLNVTASSVMLFPLVHFIKTRSAFSSVSVLLGTLIGFLLGVYIPVGTLPGFAQTIVQWFPISHGCALLRTTFVGPSLKHAIPIPSILSEVEQEMGITFTMFDHTLSSSEHGIILLITILGFTLLSLWCYHRTRKQS